MRTITVVAIGFLLILAFGIGAYAYVNSSASQMAGQLKTAEDAIRAQKWELAQGQLASVQQNWDRAKSRWAVLLDHEEIDNIDISIKRLAEYVKSKGSALALGEVSALRLLVEHISDKEAPNIKNIL